MPETNDTFDGPPSLCPPCREHVDQSNLHWVLCGGLKIGMHTQPKRWMLRPMGEVSTVKRHTKDLQRLAAAVRLLHETKLLLQDVLLTQSQKDVAVEKITRFIKSPANDERTIIKEDYGPRDWEEDDGHENGGYHCRCVVCYEWFLGHKRRGICKLCANVTVQTVSRDGDGGA